MFEILSVEDSFNFQQQCFNCIS